MTERRDTAEERAGACPGPGVGASGGDRHRGDLVSLRAQRVVMVAFVLARLRALAERLWVLPLAALGLVVVDAALALPGWARATLGVAMLAMVVWAVLGVIWPGRRAGRLSVLGAARLLEERLGLRDNALVNALQLRAALASGDGVEAALAERVVDHGVDVARASEGTPVVDGRGAARAWGVVACTLIVVAASVPLLPRVWAAGVPRYADPFGAHPAWSPTAFVVDVSPHEILVGDDATVGVRLGGRIPESVELVFLDGAGEEIDRAGMVAIDGPARAGADDAPRPREYRLTLHDLREPARFYPRAPTGRGGIVEIDVLDKPRIVGATSVVRPPDYTGLDPIVERVDPREGGARRRVLVGSEVELRVGASVEIGSVGRAAATLTGDIEVSGRSATQRVIARAPGQEVLSIRPLSRSGLAADETVRLSLDVVADAPPRVEVRAPAGPEERAAVLVGTGVPVRGTGEDDVRLVGLEVEWRVRRLGDQEAGSAQRVPLLVGRAMRTRWDGRLTLDTGAIGARAGDEIELWVVGTDNRGDSFGGPQTTRVGPILVSVIDEKEFRRRSLERMGIDDIVEPYEEIARAAEEFARAASVAADVARRAARGEASVDEAARADREALEQRDALRARIERRLSSDPLVDFDESMRPALEGLRDRLEGHEAGPGRGSESADEGAERAGRNAERADLGAREAAMDVAAPVGRLRLAAAMRAELDRLDRIAKRQRALSDRLAAMGELPAPEAVRIAQEQQRLMEEADDVCVRLDRLGDAAAHELPGVGALEGAEVELSRARRSAQESIEAARDAADGSASNLVDGMVRAGLRDAADLALTDLYFASDPALDAVGGVGGLVKERGARLDEPDVGGAAAEGRERIREALEAVEAIERHLEEVRERVRRESAGRTAQREGRRAPALAAVMLVAGVVGEGVDGETGSGAEPASGSLDGFVRALEVARVRLGALKVRLREAEGAMSAPLPVMGGSAIELADRVAGAEIAPTMHDAEWALGEGDLGAAQERAALAADRLEALYESVSGGEPSACPATEDTPLRLLEGEPAASSQGGRGRASSGSAGQQSAGAGGADGGLPSALDVLSRSGGGGRDQSVRAGTGDQGEGSAGGSGSNDRGGFERAGGSATRRGSDGTAHGTEGAGAPGGGEPDAGEARAGSGDARGADRARRFNERLYAEPVELDRPVEGGGEGARAQAEVIHLEGDPVGRQAALRRTLAASGMSEAEVEAVFERVPAAYRDVVAAYLMRIARDEASGGASATERSP